MSNMQIDNLGNIKFITPPIGVYDSVVLAENDFGGDGETFQLTVNQNTTDPYILTFSVNNNAEETLSRSVTLDNTCANNPTHYMVSQTSDFAGETWQTYSISPSFTITGDAGIKTIFFKVKNANSESNKSLYNIRLILPIVSSFIISDGATDTYYQPVTISASFMNGAIHCIISENSNFANANWRPCASLLYFTLSQQSGTKTIYCKARNSSHGESDVVSDSINLLVPSVSSFSLNDGAISSNTSTVTLNSVCQGLIGSFFYYKAHEDRSKLDGNNMGWGSYQGTPFTPYFNLSRNNGIKTVYFKVKTDIGESNVVSDSITLNSTQIPVIAPIPSQRIQAGNIFMYSVIISQNAWESLSLSGQPSGMTIAMTGAIKWEYPITGNYIVAVKVSNSFGDSETSFNLTVANFRPSITSVTDQEVLLEDGVFSYQIQYQILRSEDTAVFSLAKQPTGMSINSLGLISWNSVVYGIYPQIRVIATNYYGSNFINFRLRVYQILPVVDAIPSFTIYGGTSFSYQCSAIGSVNSWSLANAPSGMTIVSGLISWAASVNGAYSIAVRARNYEGYGERSFILNVNTLAPALTHIDTLTFSESGFQYQPTLDSGVGFIWELLQAPMQVTMNGSFPLIEIDQNTGLITSTDLLAIGDHDVEISCSNPSGADSELFHIFITGEQVLFDFKINNGATETYYREVSFTFSCYGTPVSTQYMVSENSDFTNVDWVDFTSNGIDDNHGIFVLNATLGEKDVYLKIRNSIGESNAVHSTIELKIPVINSFSMNDDVASTSSRTVNFLNSCNVTPTHYVISEDNNFSGAVWVDYLAESTFDLSSGNGTKTVYFKIKTGGTAAPLHSEKVYDSIFFTLPGPPVIIAFSINNGETQTFDPIVTLSFSYANNPTEYIVSDNLNFSGATWVSYPSSSIDIRIANDDDHGTHWVFLKARNISGESDWTARSINYNDPLNPVVTSFFINNGDAYTIDPFVALTSTCTNSPTQYIASYYPDFRDAVWNSYSAVAWIYLKTYGSNTIYFAVQNEHGQYYTSDSIILNQRVIILDPPPAQIIESAITSFTINSGALSTTSATVILSSVCTNSPIYYRASESVTFSDMTWDNYTSNVSFILPPSRGWHYVHFQVKGIMPEWVSGVRSYVIYYDYT